MSKKIRTGLCVCAGLLAAVVLAVYTLPKLRATVFVKIYHTQIEASLVAYMGVPASDAVVLGYQSVNSWEGDHPMTEFILMSYGSTYYGCYYSPDDVPLAFQNTAAALAQTGTDRWEWRAEGDNHGATVKILPCWYYFEASF